jgi:hypothetical protein
MDDVDEKFLGNSYFLTLVSPWRKFYSLQTINKKYMHSVRHSGSSYNSSYSGGGDWKGHSQDQPRE